jgi:hypothetical protein
VNHKRFARLIREDNILCLRRKKFVTNTDSNLGLKVYPNLAGEMELTGIDQLWVAEGRLAGRVFTRTGALWARVVAGSNAGRRSGN